MTAQGQKNILFCLSEGFKIHRVPSREPEKYSLIKPSYSPHHILAYSQFFLDCFSLIIFLKTSDAWLVAAPLLASVNSWFRSCNGKHVLSLFYIDLIWRPMKPNITIFQRVDWPFKTRQLYEMWISCVDTIYNIPICSLDVFTTQSHNTSWHRIF